VVLLFDHAEIARHQNLVESLGNWLRVASVNNIWPQRGLLKIMNGAESLVHTLVKSGIEVCFANPGTSEMNFVAALDRIPGLRCIPGMQENVVTGMADGYFRIARKPATTLLHCGPGLANGLANLHNARRARSGIVNIVGDQATYHSPYDPPLATDTAGFAAGVSSWVRTARDSSSVGRDAAVAVQVARKNQIATLILPADTAWTEGGVVADALPNVSSPHVDVHAIEGAVDILRSKKNVLLLLGNDGLRAGAQIHAARIRAKTGCAVMAESINGLHQRGVMPIERVPYGAAAAIEALKDFTHIILVGARGPVGFFAYPNMPSLHYPESAMLHRLARVEQNAEIALEALADLIGAPKKIEIAKHERPSIPKGLPSSEGFGRMLAAVMPENSIVMDEAISFGAQLYAGSHNAPPHEWMMVTGGAIGYGLPCAAGAAVAGGGRRVIAAQADGSGMYTLQALWTMAREKLPVTTVILSNRKYQILLAEYANVGANPGRTALDMLDIGNPDLDWVKLANGMGVEAAKADTLEGCAALMQDSFKRSGPFLIELAI
jgi:acetolactate synthase I/II/III large subunit